MAEQQLWRRCKQLLPLQSIQIKTETVKICEQTHCRLKAEIPFYPP